MIRKILIILSLLSSGLVWAQEEIVIGRSVISTAGTTFKTQNTSYSFTVGEPILGTYGYDSGYLTQGYQQPYDPPPIRYDKLVIDESCPEIRNGSIVLTNFRGCITGDYKVTWQDGLTGNNLENLKTGWYYFRLESCDSIIKDSVLVGLTSENPCALSFYTAFSPNQDGVNDTWEIDNIAVPPNDINEIIFYNIWGQEINTFSNYDNQKNVWDGKNKNGVDMPEGTYYFVLTLSFTTYSGYIELTR